MARSKINRTHVCKPFFALWFAGVLLCRLPLGNELAYAHLRCTRTQKRRLECAVLDANAMELLRTRAPRSSAYIAALDLNARALQRARALLHALILRDSPHLVVLYCKTGASPLVPCSCSERLLAAPQRVRVGRGEVGPRARPGAADAQIASEVRAPHWPPPNGALAVLALEHSRRVSTGIFNQKQETTGSSNPSRTSPSLAGTATKGVASA